MVQSKNTITVRYISNSKSEAQRWRASIRRRLMQKATTDIHSIQFYYPVPKHFMYFLSKIYRMRENIAGYDESFSTWLQDCFVPRMTIITDQAGNNPQWVIKERQGNIVGYYDSDEEPSEISKDDDAGRYSAEFTYTFFYERPDTLVMEYPIVIHNQLIGEEMVNKKQIEHKYPLNYYLNESANAFFNLHLTLIRRQCLISTQGYLCLSTMSGTLITVTRIMKTLFGWWLLFTIKSPHGS